MNYASQKNFGGTAPPYPLAKAGMEIHAFRALDDAQLPSNCPQQLR